MTFKDEIQALVNEAENSHLQLGQIVSDPKERGTLKHRIAYDTWWHLHYTFYSKVKKLLEAEV